MTAPIETPLTDISERLASASLRNAGFFSVGFCRVLDMQVLETALAESRAECERLRKENFALAAGACLCVKGDEHGNAYCEMKREAETREREAYERAAKVCEKVATEPSSLWEEPGCWSHAASNCAIHCRALSGERREG